MPALNGSKNKIGFPRVVQAGVFAATPMLASREGFCSPFFITLRHGLSPDLYSHGMLRTSS